jgi:soluble lytic murein transglycosylase-like protein
MSWWRSTWRSTWSSSVLWIILVLLPVVVMASAHKHVKHKHWTNKYDSHFRKYTKHYFGPGFDWHWFKAQAIAESSLNPKAKSRVGAIGLMQIMPTTYGEIVKFQPTIGKIENPKWNVAAAIYYNRQMYKRWKKKKISLKERLNFTFASYNAGFSRVLRAMKKAREKHTKKPEVDKNWDVVSPFTPAETRNYIRRIDKLMQVNPVKKSL